MIKKLTKHGNSRAVILNKPVLEMLGITDKTNLKISIEDGSIVITPVKKKTSQSKSSFKNTYKKIMDKYADDFKKLAE